MRDNRSLCSLGSRTFDEKTVLTDFDIFKAAKGADNIFIKEIKAFVRSGALEIRFHWDGKGTTAIPVLEYMAQSTKSASDVESGNTQILLDCTDAASKGTNCCWFRNTWKTMAWHMLYLVAKEGQRKLDWRPRQRICVGIANGLAFLHEESTLKIVHGDNKTTNLLLNEDLNSKISDFSLAKLDEEENTTSALELLELCDLLEIVAGKSNMKYQPDENLVSVYASWIGLIICLKRATWRSMFAMVSMIEGQQVVPELVMDPDTQWVGSSSSSQDLYQINHDSQV
ncbi:hypothetical protein POTOM_002379 [Populus tomentosa]|uniref:non-specific serine/threonine protein kinase n=1 Tax=Populus tomentosa TaxID=118781 RepID=A0A8X8IWU5_POPTO|nr:hypothetical protein POTOM_002379 [Populus tomentosa]